MLYGHAILTNIFKIEKIFFLTDYFDRKLFYLPIKLINWKGGAIKKWADLRRFPSPFLVSTFVHTILRVIKEAVSIVLPFNYFNYTYVMFRLGWTNPAKLYSNQ